jgi:hypothetical protein
MAANFRSSIQDVTEDSVSLGGTEWTVVELDGDPLELAADERAPMLVFDLEESRIGGTEAASTGSWGRSR